MSESKCCLIFVVLILCFQVEIRGEVVVVGPGGVVYTDDLALVAGGDDITVCTLQGGGTELGSAVGNISARALDPYTDALVALPAGDRSLAIPISDPFLGAVFEAEFWDETVQGSTVRRGSVRVYRVLPDQSEEIYISADCDGMRVIDDYDNIEYDDTGAAISGVVLETPTLTAHGSDHMADLIALCGGTANADVSWMLVVSTSADRWALVASRVDASFDRLRDETTVGYGESTVSNTAYVEILSESASAEQDYRDETYPVTSGATAAATLSDLDDAIAAHLTSGDITDQALAGRLSDACETLQDALDLHANMPTSIDWGNPSF